MMKKVMFVSLMISGMLFGVEQRQSAVALTTIDQITKSTQLKQFGSIFCTEEQEQKIVNLIVREVLTDASKQQKSPVDVARTRRNEGIAEHANLYVEFCNLAIEKLQLLPRR